MIVRLGGGAGGEAPVAPGGKSFFQVVPWPLLTLFGGVLLAGSAVYLVTLILFPFAFVTGFRLVWGMLFTPFDLPERFRAE